MSKTTNDVPWEQAEVKQAVATTTVQHKDKSVTEVKEIVGEAAYTQPTCNVGFSLSATRNLGNYNSVKAEVRLNMPCYPNEIDEVFTFAKDWVDGKLEQVMGDIDADLK